MDGLTVELVESDDDVKEILSVKGQTSIASAPHKK
jgi:hypothetical protein